MAYDAGPRGTGVAFGLIDDAEIAALQEWTEPKSFRRGMFAGKTMRFKLEMAQGPLHGRRKTDKDRRPLAHVPIARLRVKECWRSRHHDGWDEEELDVANIDGTLLVCAADISGNHGSPLLTPRPSSAHGDRMGGFGSGGDMQASNNGMVMDGRGPHHRIWVPPPDPAMRLSHLRDVGAPGPGIPGGIIHPPPLLDPREQHALSRADLAVAGPGPSSLAHRASWTGDSDYSRGMYMVHEAGQEDWDDMQDTQLRAAGTVRRHRDDLSDGGSSDDGVGGPGMMSRHYSDRRAGKRIRTENARNLYGSLHVAGVKVLAPEGGMGLWFLFTDLCVRYEGTFRLRMRCFDLSSVEEFATTGEQFLAQAFSGLFKVYSPRNFPGLPKQTELSEHFSRQGFKLNTRKNERQIKTPPPASGSNKSVSPKKPPASSLTSAPPSYGRDRGEYDSDRDRYNDRDRDWDAGRSGGRDRQREWDLDGLGLDRVPRLPGGQPAPPPALTTSHSAPPPPSMHAHSGGGSSSVGPAGGHYRVHSGSMPRDGGYEYDGLPPPPPPPGSMVDHRYAPGPHGAPPPGGPSPMPYTSHPHSHPSSAHSHSHPHGHPYAHSHSHSLPPPPISHLHAQHGRSGSTSASSRSPYGAPSSHTPVPDRDRSNGYPTAPPLAAEGSATRRSFEQMNMGPPFPRGVAAPAAAPPPVLPPLATPVSGPPVGGAPGPSPLAGPAPPTVEQLPGMTGPGGPPPPTLPNPPHP